VTEPRPLRLISGRLCGKRLRMSGVWGLLYIEPKPFASSSTNRIDACAQGVQNILTSCEIQQFIFDDIACSRLGVMAGDTNEAVLGTPAHQLSGHFKGAYHIKDIGLLQSRF
jgi:hypothetical protein